MTTRCPETGAGTRSEGFRTKKLAGYGLWMCSGSMFTDLEHNESINPHRLERARVTAKKKTSFSGRAHGRPDNGVTYSLSAMAVCGVGRCCVLEMWWGSVLRLYPVGFFLRLTFPTLARCQDFNLRANPDKFHKTIKNYHFKQDLDRINVAGISVAFRRKIAHKKGPLGYSREGRGGLCVGSRGTMYSFPSTGI